MAQKKPQTKGPLQLDREKLKKHQEELEAQKASQKENQLKQEHYQKLIEEMAPPKQIKQTEVFFHKNNNSFSVLLYDRMGYAEGAMSIGRDAVLSTNFDMNAMKLTLVLKMEYREGGERKVPNVKVNKEGQQYQDGYKDAPYFVGRHDVLDIIGIDAAEKVFNFLYGADAFVPIRQVYADVDAITQKITERFEKEVAEGKHRPVESGLVKADGSPLTQDTVDKPASNLIIVP